LRIWLAGIETTFYLVLIGTCIGIFLVHIILIGFRTPDIGWLLNRLERKEAMSGDGSMYYALGTLFILGLLRENTTAAASVILILAIGDSLATYIGMTYGKIRLPWNNRKTLEGSIGFTVGAMCVLLILPSSVTLAAILVAVAFESLPRLDQLWYP
jgi:dolichol kinase